MSRCTEFEDWLLESSTEKSEYEARVQQLKDLIEPMQERAAELEAREGLSEEVESQLATMKKLARHISYNLTWVSENKTNASMTQLKEFESWWSKKQEQQKELPLHEAPAFTAKEVKEKLSKQMKKWVDFAKTKKP